jgi:hypothetical protein
MAPIGWPTALYSSDGTNVGIGTSSMAHKLRVNGDVFATVIREGSDYERSESMWAARSIPLDQRNW